MQEEPERTDSHGAGNYIFVRTINTTSSVTPRATDPWERKML
jgi:hypothetical protein